MGEWYVNGLDHTHTFIEVVGHFNGTYFRTASATGTDVFYDIPGLLLNYYVEVTNVTVNFFHFSKGDEFDVFVLTSVHRLRGQDTHGTVQGRECFVQLGHSSTDGGLFFHQVGLESHVSQVESRLNTSYTTTNYQCFVDHIHFGGFQSF